ncbi:PREDICTED: F-box protein At3g62430 [Camelina sativa]|uniref:F-box protein At3g62430 n=1 Tax=Camelina sativa TaxID=90675 RepID=A0ABM1R1W1_CAMSA|nr:PREDICTED: F-box protein At3g62430 [Camelina sativa]XP_019092998.1 PREDICTED: F-box protein At3g62430 [Camelina sativa]XP_019092999.1 PREDICTED: F-box protein At3g62430 [Camelina sativa]XP_019093000.1 PREDICTED: F-box protein At3g62430 [Camelina sativa]XP_019093001.1 PREDICTED: F-box protein At3g62430 [Camelina sativa]XP_019093002.1 PREDICTED: F-box protein At3g62430 [Camelina sativa]XP_019093003.1 PREDICTED: F-box protein At3g62430 [Camelina sativa]
MDRISNLPDDFVVTHVVSFLSAKAAACLKCTSKKWRNLLTVIPSAVLVGSSSSAISTKASLKKFADRLASARHAIHRLRRFSLKLQSLDFAQYSTVNDCLRDAFKCGVLDLELDVNVEGDYSLPSEIFTCKSVVKMKLGSGFVIDSLTKNALLPALKTLLLDSVRFNDTSGCAFTRLLSACPVLEELVIDGFNCERWNWSHTVYSQILRRLTIRRAYTEEEDYEGYEFKRISFDIPSLAYLEYSDYIHDEFPVVSLDSLVEAKLHFNLMTYGNETDPTNLFNGLKNVQILRLDYVDTMLLFGVGSETATVFENMSHLYMPTETHFCWDGLKRFVKKSPNLRTLTIEELHYRNLISVCECLKEYSFLLTCPIEILKITHFNGYIREMVQLKRVLEKLQFLVLLDVHVKVSSDEEKLQILADLLMVPRASSKCKVQVKFG